MGSLFGKSKSKKRSEASKELPAGLILKHAAEIYEQTLKQGNDLLEELRRTWQGLEERDKMLLAAADDGLIVAPPHLTNRLERLRTIMVQIDRMFGEAGVVDDNEGAALALLRRQPWWPEFIGAVRENTGIGTADDIGRWASVTKKLAPWVYEAGRMYQTPEDYRKNGPLRQWTCRVDLAAGTVEAGDAGEAANRSTEATDYLAAAMDVYLHSIKEAAQNQSEYSLWLSWGAGANRVVRGLNKIPGCEMAPDSLDKAKELLEVGIQAMVSLWYHNWDAQEPHSDDEKEIAREIALSNVQTFLEISSEARIKLYLGFDRTLQSCLDRQPMTLLSYARMFYQRCRECVIGEQIVDWSKLQFPITSYRQFLKACDSARYVDLPPIPSMELWAAIVDSGHFMFSEFRRLYDKKS